MPNGDARQPRGEPAEQEPTKSIGISEKNNKKGMRKAKKKKMSTKTT